MIRFLRADRVNVGLRLRSLYWQIVVDSFVVIINSNTQYFFSIFLTHNMSVQIFEYLKIYILHH